MKKIYTQQDGQVLVTLLIFMVASIIITTAAVAVILTNSLSANTFQQGTTTYGVAESGAENAILQLLRNPSYTGEAITLGTDTVVTTVSGGSGQPYIIVSKGTSGDFIRTIEVHADYINNKLTVTSWKEI